MTDGVTFDFADESRSGLDQVLDDLMLQVRHVQETQGRLRSLLSANQLVVEQLDLPVLLRRIVEAAVELVGAEFGALGVVSPQGELEQFIHVGMSDAQVAATGRLPEGHGLLGAIIDKPVPIRLEHMTDDERSVGFPTAHPSMDGFLGVPVRVRDAVYGNLYLTNRSTGTFSSEDEQLVTALAVTAGIAIENARLYSETRMRQGWSAASAEITAAMLSSPDGHAIDVLVDRVHALADAAAVCVLLPTPDRRRLTVVTARGLGLTGDAGVIEAQDDSAVHGVLEGGQPRLFDHGDLLGLVLPEEDRWGTTMVVPLVTAGRARGVLLVARASAAPRFAMADLGMAAAFADQASLAMELSIARADQERASRFEDRGRIARDLHDHVIQQLFAAGLELESVARTASDARITERLGRTITHIDASITHIRTIIFALKEPDGSSTRLALIDLVGELAVRFLVTPTITFTGPVDLAIVDDLARDVVAVTREGLTNAARHAEAEHVSIVLSVAAGRVVLELTDDGVGIPPGARRSGLRNLGHRAARRGGTLEIRTDSSGTRLTWSVPVANPVPVGPIRMEP